MPTMRLGDNEHQQIYNSFKRVAKRANNNKVFPLVKDDFPEFGYSLLEPRIAERYIFLRNEAVALTSCESWNPSIYVNTKEYKYYITLASNTYIKMPLDDMVVPDTHPKYAKLLKWAEEQHAVETRVNLAMNDLETIVYSCSSVGQIKRVLQEDILCFIPDYMRSTFTHAERRSRIPAGLGADIKELARQLEEIAYVLALGSISPEKREGMDVTVKRRKN